MMVASKQYVALTSVAIPQSMEDSKGTAFDFSKPKTIGNDIHSDEEQIQHFSGYDHPIILDKDNSSLPAATLYDPKSGRMMTSYTTEKVMVCYTGNNLDGSAYVYDKLYVQNHSAVCLEMQDYPDHMNFDQVASTILKPSDTYKSQTKYIFSCK
jgi:aldose 1-epimerase